MGVDLDRNAIKSVWSVWSVPDPGYQIYLDCVGSAWEGRDLQIIIMSLSYCPAKVEVDVPGQALG